ncbi:MAG: aromatic amino acid transaminase [Alphaproteobacteria bacterium]|nr:aromatic amino acid transaminase [Alphaproteobacteria bacterium]
MFELLETPPIDALHSVAQRYKADTRPQKMDLGVGVYRDENGLSKVLASIRTAEKAHIEQQISKSYVGLRGELDFIDAIEGLIWNGNSSSNVASVQAIGGTGAITQALQLVKKTNPHATVIVGLPTWPNHISIANQLGLRTKTYGYFCREEQILKLNTLRETIKGAQAGDILILHGPCHNPSGEDMPSKDFLDILNLTQQHGVIPLIDTAYYGLGNCLDEDMALLRQAFDACDQLMVAMSCSKAFSMYRERVGILFVKTSTAKSAALAQANLEFLGRTSYSMPPSHGAVAVSRVLGNETLRELWQSELKTMRERIVTVRSRLSKSADKFPCLGAISKQKGIFSLLPFSPSCIEKLASDHGIYLPTSGRINIAGFKTGDIEYFLNSLEKTSNR